MDNGGNEYNDKAAYDVGYGKPPTKSQFKKGQSGNPKGRPKTNRNLLDLVSDLLESDLETEDRIMSGHEAFHRATIKSALKGNQRAFKRFTRLADRCGLFKDISNRHRPLSGVVHVPLKKMNVEEETERLKQLIKEVDFELAQLADNSDE